MTISNINQEDSQAALDGHNNLSLIDNPDFNTTMLMPHVDKGFSGEDGQGVRHSGPVKLRLRELGDS